MKETLMELFEQRAFARLREELALLHPADVAELLQEIDADALVVFFRLLPKEEAAETFVELDGDLQHQLIERFSDKELKAVLDELYADDAVDFLEEMPAGVVKRVLRHADPQLRADINQLLRYPKDSAGSIMTTEYVDLKKDMTVADAFLRIRKVGTDRETVYTCYVVDAARHLLGIVTAKDLLLATPETPISELMETQIISVETHDDREEATRAFDRYDLLALPVVDHEGRLVGIVTVDDALDILQEETTEDMQKMAAMTPAEESYFKTSVWLHAKNRIPWLLFLMLSAAVTGMILSYYEATFQALPLLVSFVPMLMSTGGNCGTQSATMIIRGMALDEIRVTDLLRALWKELRIALLCGAILATVNGLRIYFQYGRNLEMTMVIVLTLILTIVIAKLLGCLLPMLAKLVKLDPAVMAAPIISTCVDAFSVTIYFQIAVKLLSELQ
ncbi:MAG: magnesium transporter [Clostridia bacterium]|nr:magnesium transporter [Clostridia bacterium]